MSRFADALRCPGFPRLAIGYAVNELGDSFGLVALSVLVFDRTGDPLATTGLFLLAKFLPALVSPLLTARLDHLRVSRALPVIYVVETVLFAVLALGAAEFVLPLVLALALVDGALALVGRALGRAAAASVLMGPGQLRAGNSLLNLVFAVAAAAGPALAGVVAGSWGVSAALWADAASFLTAAVVLGGASSVPFSAEPREQWRERFRAGLRYVRGHERLLGLMSAEGVALVFFTLITPIEVVYAKQTLGTGDAGFGALLGSWGTGIILGSLLYASASRRSAANLISGSTAILGLSYLAIAAAPGLLVACLASVLGGLGNGVQWIAVVTEIQEMVDGPYQARVLALLESLAAAAPGVGFVAGGAIAAALSPRVSYAAAGAGVLGAWVLIVRALRRPTTQRRGTTAGEGATPVTVGSDGA